MAILRPVRRSRPTELPLPGAYRRRGGAFLAANSARQRNATRVGVHVRRADYASGYTVSPTDYFRSAMRYFTERYRHVEFIVCSDDIRWCRNNLPAAIDSGSAAQMRFSHGKSPEVDLAILARCDHVIMSVGSFGWRAAWLANGTKHLLRRMAATVLSAQRTSQ